MGAGVAIQARSKPFEFSESVKLRISLLLIERWVMHAMIFVKRRPLTVSTIFQDNLSNSIEILSIGSTRCIKPSFLAKVRASSNISRLLVCLRPS